jgi:hypothetical protein
MYILEENLKVISEGFSEPDLFVADGGVVDKQKLQNYFDRSFDLFIEKMAEVRTSDSLEDDKEKELRFMLEALLAAKHILVEEEF